MTSQLKNSLSDSVRKVASLCLCGINSIQNTVLVCRGGVLGQGYLCVALFTYLTNKLSRIKRLQVPGRSDRRIFFSRVTFLCLLLFGVHSTPVLLQWHIKDPGYSAKSAGGRLQLNTHTLLTQRSQSGLSMSLSRHSLGTCLETSSRATCQGTLSHSHLSFLSHCELIRA